MEKGDSIPFAGSRATDQDFFQKIKDIRQLVEVEVKNFGRRKDESLHSLRIELFDSCKELFDVVGIDDRLRRFLDKEFVPT
ncbi:hypothetical protein JTE90_023743 [Oedothorax gibbosus]|uniref:Uncharacterized protein n=1 Tax=Oedothorax gibbosus TaxID=931172 RepID=A0AAV6UAN6_9ARAC|nr:hypothetical protein JTE90_023743 [Oedothorax gibbosus]